LLASLAAEFGQAWPARRIYETQRTNITMKSLAGNLEPHALSNLTGTDVRNLAGCFCPKQRESRSSRYKENPDGKKPSDLTRCGSPCSICSFWPFSHFDLLPPCSATFRDYALAVLRAEQVANPTDPLGYRRMMLDIFVDADLDPEGPQGALQVHLSSSDHH